MNPVLVVGAGGQVGRALVARGAFGLTRADLDITDLAQVRAAISARSYRTVINAAAYTAVDRAESDAAAAQAVNRDGPGNLAVTTAELGIPLLHVSTDYVFDGTKQGAYGESDPVGPVGVYGASKLAGEEAVRAVQPRHIILRTAWVYGPSNGNFAATMLRLAAERSELRVVADQYGGPTPAAAIADALMTVVDRMGDEGPWGTYHFSGSPAVTWHGFACAIIDQAAPRLAQSPTVTPISTADYPTPARRPANSVLDCTKIERVFGIGQPDWRTSLGTIVAAIQDLQGNSAR